jgi:hypothetical protein
MQRRFALDRRCLVCANCAVTVLGAGFEQGPQAMESVLPPLIYTGKAVAGVAVSDAMPVSRPLWELTQAP